MTQNKSFRTILIVTIFILVLGIVGWAQPAQVVQAMPPAQGDPAGLTVEVVGPASVQVGDTFELQVVASNIPDPGIFGYQFVLNWDDTVFSLVSVTTNTDFPVLAKDSLGTNTYEIAASREGDVLDLTGPITLLTVQVQANTITDPASALFFLSDVKLGRKGGIEVVVDQLIDLPVVVTDVTGAEISGNVKVEGRADDNQAGHTVVDDTVLSTTTDALGDFSFGTVDFGTYNFTADSPGFLATTCTGVVHDIDATVLNDVVLLAGDIDDSGAIDITDAVAIGAVFGSTDPQVADLNVDGVVDVLDLILMAVNFNQTSVANPWVCQ
ncbi:MAG: cohesin domain-containing protein [Chloroflexota bacterium]